MNLNASRLAVAGMGRSGVGIAKAALRRGARVTVFDEAPLDDARRLETAEHLQARGAEVVAGWHGRLMGVPFDALVVSPGFRREHPAIRDALAEGREVISEAEFAARIAQAPILAVTGTNGKSTTTVLAWLLLRARGRDAILCGNIAGSGYPERTLTEAADQAGPDAVLVAEVSCYQLEWIRTFRPRVAALTNVTEDHLDRYRDFDEYFETKLRIFSGQGEGDTAILNFDEPSTPWTRVAPAIPRDVDVRGVGGGEELRGQPTAYRTAVDPPYLALSGRQVRLADLPLYGHHNAVNAAMAWEMACSFAGEPDEAAFEAMLAALAEFRGLAHRLETLGERDGILVVNNSMCTNPAAAVGSSQALPMRQWLLMGGRTKDADPAPLRAYLDSHDHCVLFFGSPVDLAAPDSIASKLGIDAPKYPTLEAAFAEACARALPGEAIVLSPAGASTAPYANFQERGDAFRALAQAWFSRFR